MDADYGVAEKLDAIFCRNVIIYFDRPTQERILARLCNCLLPGGYLFVGHAETLHDMNLPLEPVARLSTGEPMPGADEQLPEVYVQPGESHLVREPTMLRTLLGSCVGVTFLVPRLGVGALCHPMLPPTPASRLRI